MVRGTRVAFGLLAVLVWLPGAVKAVDDPCAKAEALLHAGRLTEAQAAFDAVGPSSCPEEPDGLEEPRHNPGQIGWPSRTGCGAGAVGGPES